MTLSAGFELGPYEILEPIGAGGMGDVYKAKDTRLGRTVAIKVLPEHLAASAERKQRFEREAKVISQLNHPHICTLFDIGSQNGVDFLVLEHIEGDTLAERLKRGPLPLGDALRYGTQIADGLDEAHRAGIVHRDLKHGNVMLTASGVKILDFGLAKQVREEATPETSDAPTKQRDLTADHAVVGTLHYMAPEQLEGKTVDARADVWAFGALLYEMITGTKAFSGDSQASVITAIMTVEPPSLKEKKPLSPPLLEHQVKRCLEKDPGKRWQSVGDLKLELEWLATTPELGTMAPAPSGRSWRRLMPALVGGLVAALAVWLAIRPAPVELSRKHFSIPLPSSDTFPLYRGRIAVSPDGSLIAYAAVRDGVEKLFLRHVARSEEAPIPGTEGGRAPFFSPDGGSIGYFAEDALKRIAVDGESPMTLDDQVPNWGGGASWGANGSIVYAPRSGDILRFSDAGLYRVSSGGGASSVLTAPTDEQRHFDPELLPDGRALLYVEDAKTVAGDDDRILALSLETGNAHFLLEGSAPRVSAGHLVFVRNRDIWVVRFDASRLAIEGNPVRLVGPVFDFYFGAAFDVSNNGILVFEPLLLERELVWVNREGRATTLTPLLDSYLSPRLSLDGTRLAVGTEESDIWKLDIERGSRTRLTFSGEYSVPAWKPDGSSVVFGGVSGTMSAVPADGSEEPRVLFAGRTSVTGAWTRDGRTLVFHDFASADNRDIKVFTPSESPDPTPLLVTEFNERSVSLSPDGRWLAYVSNESGSDEVYVRAYPYMDRKRSVSTNGGIQPVWSPTGRELFYRETGRMMVVEVKAEPELATSQPRVLFDDPYAMGFVHAPNYDVSSDGRRFVMIREGGGVPRFDIVLDWADSLTETAR